MIETGVDWPCKVETRFASANLGLEANVELGLDWAFSQVERAIVLEDDCIPHPTFFDYCDELLDRYANDSRVWQIGGDRHGVNPRLFGTDSYAFTTWASVWGWATWADRWHQASRGLQPRPRGCGRASGRDPAHGSRPQDRPPQSFTLMLWSPTPRVGTSPTSP